MHVVSKRDLTYAYACPSGSDSRRLPSFSKVAGGKSGLPRTGWSITSTGREIRESAAENKPPKSPLGNGKGEKVR